MSTTSSFAAAPLHHRQLARTALAANAEPPWVRWLMVCVALAFLTLFLFVPLVAVFVEAFKKGWDVYAAYQHVRCACAVADQNSL